MLYRWLSVAVVFASLGTFSGCDKQEAAPTSDDAAREKGREFRERERREAAEAKPPKPVQNPFGGASRPSTNQTP